MANRTDQLQNEMEDMQPYEKDTYLLGTILMSVAIALKRPSIDNQMRLQSTFAAVKGNLTETMQQDLDALISKL